MPSGLELEEQLAFIALKYVYTAFRSGKITEARGREEKGRILRICDQIRSARNFWGKYVDYHAAVFNALEAPADEFFLTGDPAAAEKALRILYGLEKPGIDERPDREKTGPDGA